MYSVEIHVGAEIKRLQKVQYHQNGDAVCSNNPVVGHCSHEHRSLPDIAVCCAVCKWNAVWPRSKVRQVEYRDCIKTEEK